MDDDGGNNSSRMIRLLRMLRLLKLLRLARINRLLQRYEEEFASLMTTFKLGKLCAVIIIIGHFLSCLFFGIGSYEAEHPGDLGLDADGNHHVGWVYRQFDIEKCPPGQCMLQKYLTSFYWACMTMTTVGYGDIVPKTIYETVATIIAMVIGGFVFGLIVGNLAELSKRANAGELQRQKYVSNVQLMMLSGTMKGSVRADTERKLKAYHNNVFARRTSQEILKYFQVLPVQLRDELAQQIQKVVLALGDYMHIACHACIGGTNVRDDIRKLESGVQVVVGTPGRVHDMINRRALRTDSMKIFVLDEADEMLSRGFKDQIYDVFKFLPSKVQVGLFSATMPIDSNPAARTSPDISGNRPMIVFIVVVLPAPLRPSRHRISPRPTLSDRSRRICARP